MLYYYCTHCGFEGVKNDEEIESMVNENTKMFMGMPLVNFSCEKCGSEHIAYTTMNKNGKIDDKMKRFFKNSVDDYYKKYGYKSE